jgi:hypothetical protein
MSHWPRYIVFALIIVMAVYSAMFLMSRASSSGGLPMPGITRRDAFTINTVGVSGE